MARSIPPKLRTFALRGPSVFRQADLIGGEWVASDVGATVSVTNPGAGALIGTEPALGRPQQVAGTIAAASDAQAAWRVRTGKDRAAILPRLFDLRMGSQDDLARFMTAEQGGHFAEPKCEIAYAATFFERFGEEAKRLYGSTIPAPVVLVSTEVAPFGGVKSSGPERENSRALSGRMESFNRSEIAQDSIA